MREEVRGMGEGGRDREGGERKGLQIISTGTCTCTACSGSGFTGGVADLEGLLPELQQLDPVAGPHLLLPHKLLHHV